MKRPFFVLALTGVLMAPGSTLAVLLTYEFGGTFESTVGQTYAGQAFLGSFSYQTAGANPQTGLATLSVPGLSVSLADPAAQVTFDFAADTVSVLGVDTTSWALTIDTASVGWDLLPPVGPLPAEVLVNASTSARLVATGNTGAVLGEGPLGNLALVPEPVTLALMGLGLAGLGWNRRRAS